MYVPDGNNTLRTLRQQKFEPIATVMRTCGVLQKHSELTVFDSAFKQLERGLTIFRMLLTYVQESSSNIFHTFLRRFQADDVW